MHIKQTLIPPAHPNLLKEHAPPCAQKGRNKKQRNANIVHIP